jgi:hypothetical protein
VHSFDRDITKWKNSNHFEVDLPEAILNIQSIRLVQISLPSNQYVFSNEYQNTKLSFTDIYAGVETQHTITISEGSYTGQEIAIEIENRMNQITYPSGPLLLTTYAFPNQPSASNTTPTPTPGAIRYLCKYNECSNTFWFGKSSKVVSGFTLDFDKQETYTTKCNQPLVWKHYTRWGLPAYLGYKKQKYSATPTTDNSSGFIFNMYRAPTATTPAEDGDPYGFSYDILNQFPFNAWLDGKYNFIVDASTNCQIDIFGEQVIYMELDRFNTIDEIEPYSDNTMSSFNNDLNGKVKASFAKIPVLQSQFTQQTDNAKNNLMNISHYNPVIERINRLKFKFRYHDGRLVDFNCVPFNFSLEFNCLRDRMDKKITIVVPPLY